VLACGCYHHIPDLPIDAAEGSDARADAAADAPRDAQPAMIDAAPPGITRVQQNNNFFNNAGAQVSLPFQSTQQSGNMNVVILGWINDHTLSTPTDDAGNSYQLAGSKQLNGMNQAIYYACDIATRAGNNVTVSFDTDLQVDMVILEYSGIVTAGCFDQLGNNSGNTLNVDSGNVTTQKAHELLVASAQILNNASGTDPSFPYQLTFDFSMFETKEVFAKGTFHATATQGMTGDWVMQIATFKGL
jgi:hypothetical protein